MKLKTLKLILLFITIIILSACDPSLINPDSYGVKWKNTYVWFNPEDLETIYISEQGEINSAKKIINNTDFEVDWTTNGEGYELIFTSNVDRIDFAWFDGYPVDNINEEIPFIIVDNVYYLSSNKLLPPENGLYRISISKDLTK